MIWSEIVSFLLGLGVMYVINFITGFATEHGRKVASGEHKIEKEIKKIVDYLKIKGQATTQEVLNDVFKNKKDIDDVYLLLLEIESLKIIRRIRYDQETKPTAIWLYKK
mgnify:CR=1 FL=1